MVEGLPFSSIQTYMIHGFFAKTGDIISFYKVPLVSIVDDKSSFVLRSGSWICELLYQFMSPLRKHQLFDNQKFLPLTPKWERLIIRLIYI